MKAVDQKLVVRNVQQYLKENIMRRKLWPCRNMKNMKKCILKIE